MQPNLGPFCPVGTLGRLGRWSVGLVGGVLVLCWERRGFNDKRRDPGWLATVKFWGLLRVKIQQEDSVMIDSSRSPKLDSSRCLEVTDTMTLRFGSHVSPPSQFLVTAEKSPEGVFVFLRKCEDDKMVEVFWSAAQHNIFFWWFSRKITWYFHK